MNLNLLLAARRAGVVVFAARAVGNRHPMAGYPEARRLAAAKCAPCLLQRPRGRLILGRPRTVSDAPS